MQWAVRVILPLPVVKSKPAVGYNCVAFWGSLTETVSEYEVSGQTQQPCRFWQQAMAPAVTPLLWVRISGFWAKRHVVQEDSHAWSVSLTWQVWRGQLLMLEFLFFKHFRWSWCLNIIQVWSPFV